MPDTVYDRMKQMMMVESDRPHVLREMIYVCRPAGVISIPGVYGGLVDKISWGQAMNKGLTFRMGQTHVNRWTDDLLRRIEQGQIDPSFVITHTARLEDGPEMYKVFRDKQDACVKVVFNGLRGSSDHQSTHTLRVSAETRARLFQRNRSKEDLRRFRRSAGCL